MFNLLNLNTGAFYLHGDGGAVVFESGDTAANQAVILTASTGDKWQVRRVPQQSGSADWRARERERFTSGWYESPSWLSVCPVVIPADHFVHVSRDDRSVLAYTKDESRGLSDVQTRISVLGYLSRFCGITEKDAMGWQAIHYENYVPQVVQFARTADEILAIYRACDRSQGLGSCMTHSLDNYRSHVHPVTVYGDSDLVLAYIRNDAGEVTARSLIWEDGKVYNRLYGDCEKLARALQELGFKAGEFHGAKIRRIESEGSRRLVLPYLDSVRSVRKLDSNWLMIDRNGTIRADRTDGLESGFCCSGCENEDDEDFDTVEVLLGRGRSVSWCTDCADEYATYCSSVGEYVRTDNTMTIDGEFYPDWWGEDHTVNYCEWDDEYTFSELTVVWQVQWDESRFVSSNFGERARDCHAFKCRIDGNWYHDSLLVSDVWADAPRCRYVYPSDMPSDYDSGFDYRALNNESLNFKVA